MRHASASPLHSRVAAARARRTAACAARCVASPHVQARRGGGGSVASKETKSERHRKATEVARHPRVASLAARRRAAGQPSRAGVSRFGPPAVIVCCRRTPRLPALDAAQRRAHPRRTPQLHRARRLSVGPWRCWRAAARCQQPAHGSAATPTMPVPVRAAAAHAVKRAQDVRSQHAPPTAPGGRPPDWRCIVCDDA